MLRLLKKTYRKTTEIKDTLLSSLRILNLKLKYPNISIIGKTKIGKNCYIVCDDESRLILRSVTIANNSSIVALRGGNISISNSYIGFNCMIVSRNEISIEKNCEIAEFTVIRDQDHRFGSINQPISKQGYNSSPIKIKQNVWVGAKSTILKGVVIEKNCVVAAHSLVNKSFLKSCLIAGLPAKKIRLLD